MQRVSNAYKDEQSEYLRQESYVYVYLGVVNKEAQKYAVANGTFTIYSEKDKINGSPEFEAYYATPEENMAKTDASVFFLPRKKKSFALYQGAVTQDIKGAITFRFNPYTDLDIKGLTIDFGDYYPTKFTVTNGNTTYTYTYENNEPGIWVTEDIFRNTEYIKITPITMVGGRQRLRILSILFGVGLLFDNTSLLSTSWKSSASHIMETLPQKTFQFSVNNLNKKFAADDPRSFTSFLQEQQAVEFDYGRKLLDGSLYTIPGGKLKLKTWSSDDTQANFQAVGFLDYLSGTYTKGQYYPNGISLYDLAVDVCNDAGIENYVIDNYLKKLKTHNPLPIEKHKNLLQLIANSARSVMLETRDGGLEIHSSFIPEITSVTSNGATIYSNVKSIIKDDVAYLEYGTSEKDFTFTDATQFFVPRSSKKGYIEVGYVSSEVSKEDGKFNTNPRITIQWETAWTFFNMNILFSDTMPIKFTVRTYSYGENIENFTWKNIDLDTLVEHAFYNIDKIIIEFTSAKPYQRIHVGKVWFGDVSDYSIDYKDMSVSPTATKTDFIRNVNVNYYEYSYGTTFKKIGTTKAVKGVNEVKYTKPYHGYSLAYTPIKDDETTYAKWTRVNCNTLPDVESAKSKTLYFVPTSTSGKYKVYDVASATVSYSWNFVTSDPIIVDELPSEYAAQLNTIYLVKAGTNKYSIYQAVREGMNIKWDSLGSSVTVVTKLPAVEKVSSTSYSIVSKGSNQLEIYNVKETPVPKKWKLISNATETIVNSLPSTFDADTIYLVKTSTSYVYHSYFMIITGTTLPVAERISLGYDIRGTLTINYTGAYYLKFTSNVALSVDVSAYEFDVSTKTYTSVLNQVGTDKTASNVLLDTLADAKDAAEWLCDYYKNDVSYTISYRGEPALDPDDLLYIENKYVDRNLIRLSSAQIDTSQGMSMDCKLESRRVSYKEAAKVDIAIVDESEVV